MKGTMTSTHECFDCMACWWGAVGCEYCPYCGGKSVKTVGGYPPMSVGKVVSKQDEGSDRNNGV